MKYICKVFTPTFKDRFNEQLKIEMERELTQKGISSDRKSFAEEFVKLQIISSFNYMWNNPNDFSPFIKDYYKSLGLWTPEYTTIELEAQERGYQSQPRVLWNNEVVKIDEIDEIFSFVSVG